MTFREYASVVRLHEMAVIDRAIHSIFWLKNSNSKEDPTCREIADLITEANLPDPNVTRLTQLLKNSRRIVKGRKVGTFRLHPATEEELERAVGYLFAPSTPPPPPAAIPTDVPFFGQADVALAREMSEIFVQLHCLENSARNLIRSKLEAAHGADWWNQVHTRDMDKKVRERIREEQRNKWHQPRGRHPLNYLDFGDLKDLICNSWAYFKNVFPDQHWLVARLSELEKCRNVIAHNNVLGDIEISRIRLYFGDWCRQIGGVV
jgi:hypothetical protein